MATAMLNARIWYHDQALSTQLNAVALDYSAEELDATVLTDTTRTRAGGIKDAQAAIAGFWNSAEDKALFDAIGLNKPLLIAEGPAQADISYGMVAIDGVWSLRGEHGELLGFEITLNSGNNGPLVRGELMIAQQVVSSGTSGTAQQLGAVSAAQRFYAGIHVTQFNATSLDVSIRSDDAVEFTTSTQQLAFAQAVGLTSEWASVAGPITDDWWRVTYTLVGTSATFALAAGIL